MAWLYLNPELTAAQAVVGARVAIRGEEAAHAVKVARTRVGERVSIGNGDGVIVTGAVVSAEPGELVLEVDEVRDEPDPQPQLWLAQALAKGGRDEMAVQAATELGVAGIVPWSAERSVTRWDATKAAKGRARWESIAREAAKQSIRTRVPEVTAPQSTAELARGDGLLLVLDPGGAVPISQVELPSAGRVTFVVGPEGGISPRELALLADAGAVGVRLGPEVLRTSTAGPAAIAVLAARLGRW
ncbi:16S rRNA (uracil(1498)-N(3))-methyltransferase [Schumannella luteola]|uniref:Ribosomal RNA small subunit methyltransferase E n=1 Tax=Schumannella luteola TaxID=472059 RepID=A0A852YRI9_9MICO|nr:16S rRNA (uracil(1498)-N(3))-methyltransferase [Schumannella luteola]NYH00320.1 16S rRNA (uracil1498-N3)-methyltransferase [Schumannella luteola]TPX05993.1 16S rRNA (uracil(1498)-N(3))-methyltransferase [Schumannella luteola]